MPGQAKVLAFKEITDVIKMLDTPRDQTIFAVGIYTGLRISEIIRLKQDQVFTTDGGIKYILTVKRLKKKNTVYSDIPVHPKLCGQLKKYQEYLNKKKKHSEWLFPSSESVTGCLSRARAHQILANAFTTLNLQGASTHSMRRTLLTTLSRSGIPLRTIQQISGHSNLGQLQGYLEVDPEDKHRAINLVKY